MKNLTQSSNIINYILECFNFFSKLNTKNTKETWIFSENIVDILIQCKIFNINIENIKISTQYINTYKLTLEDQKKIINILINIYNKLENIKHFSNGNNENCTKEILLFKNTLARGYFISLNQENVLFNEYSYKKNEFEIIGEIFNFINEEFSAIKLIGIVKNISINSLIIQKFEIEILRKEIARQSVTNLIKIMNQNEKYRNKFHEIIIFLEFIIKLSKNISEFFNQIRQNIQYFQKINTNKLEIFIKFLENFPFKNKNENPSFLNYLIQKFFENRILDNQNANILNISTTLFDKNATEVKILDLISLSSIQFYKKKEQFLINLAKSCNQILIIESQLRQLEIQNLVNILSQSQNFSIQNYNIQNQIKDNYKLLFDTNQEIKNHIKDKSENIKYGIFSPSSLQKINKNPYFYWVENVLRLRPLENLYDNIDSKTLGLTIHKIAELFAIECKQLTEKDITKDKFFQYIISWTNDTKIPNISMQHNILIQNLCNIIVSMEIRAKQMELIVMVEQEILGQISEINFRAIADRVEYCPKSKKVWIYDYKSSTIPNISEEQNGTKIQLSILIELLKLKGYKAISAKYISISKQENIEIIDFDVKQLHKNLENFRKFLEKISNFYIKCKNNWKNEEQIEHFSRKKNFLNL